MLFLGVLWTLSQVSVECDRDFTDVLEVVSISRGYILPGGLLSSDHEPMCAKEAMLVAVSV